MTAINKVSLFRLSIPMRQRVEHAEASRSVADPIVVAIEIQADCTGFGETLPRVYVTGEDHDSVVRSVRDVFVPLLLELHPESFSEALELIETLPMTDAGGRDIPAARSAIELALLDVYSRYFHRPLAGDVANWLELSEFSGPGCLGKVRCSGVVARTDPEGALKTLRLMRCFGLRDFKIKVAFDRQDELVKAVAERLRGPLARERASLRLDANGGWSLDAALANLKEWSRLGIKYVEQPLGKGDEENLQDLKAHTRWRIIHDESLVTMQNALRLHDLGVADCFNIRISKCGGLIPALKLANMARRSGVETMLGSMVGQTSILSAVERRFLQMVPDIRFLESNYSGFLLRDDVASPSLRFGYGGRLKPLSKTGWGIEVDAQKLARLGCTDPLHMNL